MQIQVMIFDSGNLKGRRVFNLEIENSYTTSGLWLVDLRQKQKVSMSICHRISQIVYGKIEYSGSFFEVKLALFDYCNFDRWVIGSKWICDDNRGNEHIAFREDNSQNMTDKEEFFLFDCDKEEKKEGCYKLTFTQLVEKVIAEKHPDLIEFAGVPKIGYNQSSMRNSDGVIA